MRRLPALVAALLLPAAPPLLVGTAAFTGALLVSQPPARAQSAEDVAKVAQAITVRIEGATQGSGVLVKRDGNRYTVLTAWHVVSGQRSGEELDIYTPDGQRHQLEQGSITRVGQTDLAELSFTGGATYDLAQYGDSHKPALGSSIYVAGYPLPSDRGSDRQLRFKAGIIEEVGPQSAFQNYSLIYSATTLPGFSGGPVLSQDGYLLGIHGQGELDIRLTEMADVAVKTGSNKGMSIHIWLDYRGLKPSLINAPSSGYSNMKVLPAQNSNELSNSKQVSIYSAAQLAETPWVADRVCPWNETTEIPEDEVGFLKIYYLPQSLQRTPYGLVVDMCRKPGDPPMGSPWKINSQFTERYRMMLLCKGRDFMDLMADGKWRFRQDHAALPASLWNKLYFSAICSRPTRVVKRLYCVSQILNSSSHGLIPQATPIATTPS